MKLKNLSSHHSLFRGKLALCRVFLLTVAAALPACGPIKLGTGSGTGDYEPPLREEYRAADKVQAIVMGQDNPGDRSLRGQYTYTVAPDRRLLVAYTFAQDLVQRAETKRGKMILRIALDLNSSGGLPAENLIVTPILKSWVLGSTWTRSNGFIKGKASEWNAPGADLDWVGAVHANREKPRNISTKPERRQQDDYVTTTTSSSTTSTTQPQVYGYVYFDITEWFQNYIKGRGANYGFAITSATGPYTFFGELSGTTGPVIIWNEL
jgi:hypothetical protein